MYQFQARTRVISGDNMIDRLGAQVRGLGIGRLFVVTDKYICSVGMVDRIALGLKEAGLEYIVFDGVEAEPVLKNIYQASDVYRQSGCQAILGLGGGSCVDTAKAISILATNPGPLESYEGEEKISTLPHPVIAVPTTAGTGSEVTGHCVFIDEDRGCKLFIRSPLVQPVLAVLDPCLLSTVPSKVAAATGINTLAHAIEAYISTCSTPITNALSIEAIRLVSDHLPAFVANNRNVESARNMQMACVMAALGVQWAGGGAVYAMANALSGNYRIPNGIASAVLLPHVMNFSLIGNLEKFKIIAMTMGAAVEGLSPIESASRSVSRVRDLNNALGIPAGLRELGVTEDSLEAMSVETKRSGLLGTNPRTVTIEDIAEIFRAAMD